MHMWCKFEWLIQEDINYKKWDSERGDQNKNKKTKKEVKLKKIKF